MSTLSGLYLSSCGRRLAVDENGRLALLCTADPDVRLRADGEFWLCRDDGLVGKFGSPTKVLFHLDGHNHHMWVEPRGFSNGSVQYGLVPVLPGAAYSNRFLAVNDRGQFEVLDSWSENSKFSCVEAPGSDV